MVTQKGYRTNFKVLQLKSSYEMVSLAVGQLSNI